MPVEGLDQPCGTCGRRSGDHTLDEWAKCLGTPTTDLPFEHVPDDAAATASAALRQQLGLDDDLILADSVIVYAAAPKVSDADFTAANRALVEAVAIAEEWGLDAQAVLEESHPESVRARE